MRLSVAVVALAGVVAVSGCKVTSEGGTAAAPSASSSVPVSSSPSASPSLPPIPTSAMLQAADLNGASMKPVDGDVGEDLRPPRPCGDAHPSEAKRVASTAMTAVYPSAGGGESTAPSVVLQTIVRYQPGAAAQAFAELNAAISRCPGKPSTETREWQSFGTFAAGDEAVLFKTSIQVRGEGETTPAPWTWPVVVARVGDDLVLVADLGWETMNGEETTVRTLIAAAVNRLRAAQ